MSVESRQKLAKAAIAYIQDGISRFEHNFDIQDLEANMLHAKDYINLIIHNARVDKLQKG